jgi:hypothetical protein
MFVFAALLLDFVLWGFVLLGWESVVIPANFASTHQPEFTFPYSHGMMAGAFWSALAGLAFMLLSPSVKEGKRGAAVLIAFAVFSHWLLDVLVHVPELPLVGGDSWKVGLGMWQNMPLALIVEAALVAVGLGSFVSGSALSRVRRFWLVTICLLVLVFTVVGMTVAPPPPSATAMAASSLLTIILLCAICAWVARVPR